MAELSILDRIVARRRQDVSAAKEAVPPAALEDRLGQAPAPIDFAARLRADGPMALIAEIKRSSPSKGDIAPDVDAASQATVYARAGAAAVSVLTEPTWFKGSLDDLLAARRAIDGPARPAVLRKDFIIDEYQLLEARAFGADAVLLIVACLDDATLTALLAGSRALGMEPLVEVSNAAETARAVAAGATVIGINNRDLHSFQVDLATTERLAGLVPTGVLLAALSGIATRADVERFAGVGASAVLVGEALMVARDPAAKANNLLGRTSEVPA